MESPVFKFENGSGRYVLKETFGLSVVQGRTLTTCNSLSINTQDNQTLRSPSFAISASRLGRALRHNDLEINNGPSQVDLV